MRPILITAFLEGMCVLVVEIAGARALAPFFGTSLRVWTAQITATLLFLALGYGVGGRLSQRGPMALPMVFWIAGGWLVLYPLWRAAVLSALLGLGVSLGAFVASAWLFGPPLLCLGAVSPLLIARMGQAGVDAGRAAGSLFFTNTLGGLAGGWLTALVLVPLAPLRLVLAGVGVFLACLGGFWANQHTPSLAVWLVPFFCAALAGETPKPIDLVHGAPGAPPTARVLARTQSPSGLVQVVERPGEWRSLLINGIDQGAMDISPTSTGASYHPFSEYLAFMAHRYHPTAKRALLMGLGCGVLAKTLHRMGMHVTVAEIDPAVATLARKYFGLPPAVHVVVEDGRAFLQTDRQQYDIVVLDAFAGETSPWYLLTREGLAAAKARLRPDGRMVVNIVTQADSASPGLQRLEAGLLDVFGEALVYVEPRLPNEGEQLVNSTLIAGSSLKASDAPYPVRPSDHVAPFLGDMAAIGPRAARPGAVIDTDEHSSLDTAEASVRLRMREHVMGVLSPGVLQD